MTVYTISYSGWSSNMVCKSVEEVLEVIKEQMSEAESGLFYDFSIDVEEMSEEEIAALPPFEWDE